MASEGDFGVLRAVPEWCPRPRGIAYDAVALAMSHEFQTLGRSD